MLQNLRKHVQGWVAVVIASILCVAFALWGIEYYLSDNKTRSVVAKVNGTEITAHQLDIAYKRARDQMHFPLGASPELNQALQTQLKNTALQELVTKTVLYQAAQKQGYQLSNAQISALIAKVPAFYVNGQFSPALYQRFIRQYFASEQAFIENIQQDSAIMQSKQGILGTAFVLPKEVDHALLLAHQMRDFAYMVIPAQRFLAEAAVQKNAVQTYYQAHPNEFMLPEQFNVAYIVLSDDKIAAKVSVTKADVDQYFQDNPALKAADSAVHQQAEKTLRQQKLDQLLANASDQLANLTYTNPDSLKPAADALNLPIQETGFFAREGNKTGILTNPKVLTAVFSDSVLKDHNNSDLISLDDHTVLVLRVTENKPAAVRPFAEVEDRIAKTLTHQAAANAAKRLGQQIQAAVQKDADLSQQAKLHDLSIATKSGIGRENKEIPAAILTLAFSLSPALDANSLPVNGATLANGDYVVLQLQKVQNGTINSLPAAERAAEAKKMALVYGTWEYYLYANQNLRDAKIKKP